MISMTGIRNIWLARYRIDFRKGHWSLLAEAYGLGLKLLEGDVRVFIGRDRRKMKIIHSDPAGLWVSYKVFHKSAMKTLIELTSEPARASITNAELGMLIEGYAFTVHKRVKSFVRNPDWPYNSAIAANSTLNAGDRT
jgi:hypothetical protein